MPQRIIFFSLVTSFLQMKPQAIYSHEDITCGQIISNYLNIQAVYAYAAGADDEEPNEPNRPLTSANMCATTTDNAFLT